MFKITFLIIVLLLAGCVAPTGSRPSSFNYPPTYLENFKLGISEEEAVKTMGVPDSAYEIGGKRWLKYLAQQKGTRSYNLLVENGIVTDVIYNESGSLNGQSARALQKK